MKLDDASLLESRRAARLNYFLSDTEDRLETIKHARTENILIAKQILSELEREGIKPSPAIISFLQNYYNTVCQEQYLEFQRTMLSYVLEVTHRKIVRLNSINGMCGGDKLGTS